MSQNKYQDKHQVIVLWIDDLVVNRGKSPNYRNLETIINHISPNTEKEGAVLTLSGSDELLNLLKSTAKCKENCDLLPAEEMLIHYVRSTAPISQICKAINNDNPISECAERQSECAERQSECAERQSECAERKIVRTVPSDDYVLAAIIDELQRRIPDFGKKKEESEVWLLSEQDTFYSQVMSDTFKEIYKKRDLELKVKRIGFLKGIDGNLPDDSAATNTEAVNSINNLTGLIQMLVRRDVPKQKLFDRRQIDYLQRLAEKLHREQRGKNFNKRVEAIGILGGDVYDKMLVLEIFRRYFPATNYFTTDLDSAYLYGPKAKVARNLIIGSAFDLSSGICREDEQLVACESDKDDKDNELPVVFRDSYQTALYHRILKLLAPGEYKIKGPRIKVFEVGRSRFHQLKMPSISQSEERYSWSYRRNISDEMRKKLHNEKLVVLNL